MWLASCAQCTLSLVDYLVLMVMMLAALGWNYASSPSQTGELGHTIVPILHVKMWQFTAALLIPVIAYFIKKFNGAKICVSLWYTYISR